MIRNIIFDLGNVLLSWKPEEYFIASGLPENKRKTILNDVFRSREWLLVDNGDITTDEAVNAISSRSELSESEIRYAFNSRLQILSPLQNNIDLLSELKKTGLKLYFLSNFPDDIFDEVRNRYSFFELFDGGIISARVRLSKPDIRIYLKMIELYGLVPHETVFVDDLKANSDAAGLAGIHGIHLPEHSMLYSLLAETAGVQITI
jgi:putative hydrolase of the HAD superfamily